MLSKILLTGSILDGIGEVFLKLVYFLMLTIDSVVFWFIKLISQVFFLVVDTNMEGQAITAKMNELMDRIYIILGVGMLFFVAYKIICLMTDPDKISNDGADSMQGIVKNVVLSVIMLSLIPTAFNYLMQFQSRVVSTNVIGSIILGTSNDSSDDNNVRKTGAKVALSIYSSFYYPIDENGKIYTYYECGGRYPEAPNTPSGVPDICETYVKKYDDAMNNEGIKEFILDGELNQALVDGEMEHIHVIPVLAGAYAVWLYLLFTLDIATRAIKLLFYRLIAPIPVMMRITKPVGGAFTKWINDVIKTYLSLFIRLIIINFSLFTINIIVSLDLSELFPSSNSATWLAVLLAKVAVLLGILQFAKDAPKMVEELFGVEHIDTSVAGMKNRLNENEYAKRAAVAGGALGLGGARRAWNAWQSVSNKNSKQYAERQKRKQERKAYKERRDQYREGLSGAGRVADRVAHGASTVFGAVGAVGRAAARTVGTAGRGLAAGNVDINEIGNAIAGQVEANEQRYAEQDQKRAQRRQRAVKNKLNTGSYFFPSVQGAVGNLIDSIPDKDVKEGDVVNEGQQTKKDVRGWLTGKVNKALGTTTSARVAQDKAAIADAKAALARGMDLKCMSGDDEKLDAEKKSRQSAVYNSIQQEVSKENDSYNQKVSVIESAAAQQKSQIVTPKVESYIKQVDASYELKCKQIEADESISEDDVKEAKKKALKEAEAQKAALTSTDIDTVKEAITKLKDIQVNQIKANASLTDAQKTEQIQAVTVKATTTTDTIAKEYSGVDDNLKKQKEIIENEHAEVLSNISKDEATRIKDVNADIKKKKDAAKLEKCMEDADALAVAYNVETEDKIMSSIAKMSPESQNAIYGKMASVLGLDDSDDKDPGKKPTPENIQKQLRATFSDIRNKNISENTLQVLEQFKKSLGSALSISELSAVNAGGNKGGDKK
ncbi:MAG: hypothetical protein ACI4VT_03980 [Bacilli bacterium]